jgi:hypothetical protein
LLSGAFRAMSDDALPDLRFRHTKTTPPTAKRSKTTTPTLTPTAIPTVDPPPSIVLVGTAAKVDVDKEVVLLGTVGVVVLGRTAVVACIVDVISVRVDDVGNVVLNCVVVAAVVSEEHVALGSGVLHVQLAGTILMLQF